MMTTPMICPGPASRSALGIHQPELMSKLLIAPA